MAGSSPARNPGLGNRTRVGRYSPGWLSPGESSRETTRALDRERTGRGVVPVGAPALAAELTPEEAHTPLTSVSKRETYVFASTPDGLFPRPPRREEMGTVEAPPDMPLNGTFAKQPGKSPVVIYVAMCSKDGPPPRDGLRHGLYLTCDDGSTWSSSPSATTSV